MNQRVRRNAPIYVILAAVVIIVLVLALGSAGGDVRLPQSATPSAPPQASATAVSSSPAPPAPSGGAGKISGSLTPQQLQAYQRLTSASAQPPEIRVQEGVVRSLTVDLPVLPGIAAGARDRADAFLRDYADLFEIKDLPGQIIYFQETANSSGTSFVRYSQQYNGVPVFGGDMILAISAQGHLEALLGGYIPNLALNTSPTFQAQDAENIALADLAQPDARVAAAPGLTIYDPVVFSNTSIPHLAWMLAVESEIEGQTHSYLIDAQNGAVLLKISELIAARNREIWDANDHGLLTSQLPFMSTKVMDENGAVGNEIPDEDARIIWDHLATIYDYYWNTFGRDSYDGNGSKLKSYVDVRDSNCPNAFWHSLFKAMFYCDGVNGLDVTAHELTHGVTGSSAGLIYAFESGALNESYSDIFAAFIDDANPWLISWDAAATQVIRNIANPQNGFPDHYDDFVDPGDPLCTSKIARQTGCVHANSSIPSLAAYLLVDGGERNNVSVRGIGEQKASPIIYETLIHRLTKNASFVQARDATFQACRSLIGSHGIVAEDCEQVKNAFAAVGIGDSASVVPPSALSASAWTSMVFDTSGSMRQEDQSGVTKIEAARLAGNNILDILDAEAQSQAGFTGRIGIARFSSDSSILLDPSTDISAARSALQQISSNGGTRMASGLSLGTQQLAYRSAGTSAVMILLSDGLPNITLSGEARGDYDSVVREEVLDLARQAGTQGICIYTVGFGQPLAGGGTIDEQLLREISNASGCGDYYNAQNALQLADVYVELRHVSTGNVLARDKGSISQGEQKQVAAVDIPVNQAQLLYTLNWPAGRLESILIDPNNAQVDAGYSGASLSSSSSLSSIIIQDPVPGRWQILVNGADVPQGTTAYNAILSSRPKPAAPPTALPAPTQIPPSPPPPSPGLPMVIAIFVLVGGGIAVYVMAQTMGRRRTSPASTTAARLEGIRGRAAGGSFTLQDGAIIGRGAACQVRLDDPAVSRQHARLRWTNGQWYIQDLQSSQGTYVNGIRVSAAPLYSGDHVRVGGSEFEFHT